MDCSDLIRKKDSLEPWIKFFTTPFLKREQESKNGRDTTPSWHLQGTQISGNPTPLGMQPNIQIQVSIESRGLYQNRAKELNTRKTDKWQASTWKDVQRHSLLGEMQIKTTMSTTSHPPGWLEFLKRKISVGKDVEKSEPSYIAVEVPNVQRKCKMMQPRKKTVWQ